MEESIEQQRELPLVMRAAYMALHRRTEAVFDKYGVTADQFVLMLALRDGGTLTQRELAARISSDASTVRAMLVLLEKSGYVQRANHPTDSRAKTVELTLSGKKKLRQLWKVGQKIRDEMYGTISTREAEVLIGLLRRVAGTLSQEKAQA
jgi:DNA-binding MarR family transcriptional regulator